jgi:hypothetical protein
MESQDLKKPVHPQYELPSHEVLSRLAINEPHEYEALRQKIINEFIDTSPEKIRSRLLGIQFRVDGMRTLSNSPLGLTVGVYRMMWDCFIDLNQSWQEFVDMKSECLNASSSTRYSESHPQKSAQVLEFRRRNAP